MHYLFGFSGRINRAKMWLFFLISIIWEIVVGLVAILGLHWSHYLQALKTFTENRHSPFDPAPFPIPDAVAGTAWFAVGGIALLFVLFIVAYFAVFVKRLHDRNKSASWLLVFVALPWVLDIVVLATGSVGGLPQGLFVGPVGIVRGVAYVLVCLIGLWAFIELYFLRGTRGENRFGPDPLAK
ncbi:MAG: DUF805 domain-containing protein [Rhizomicrobium sp.]|nr:DUF805 domain-containing protein [Rhizomicrobium sp.]